jgi:hypothetical protein
MCYTNLHNATSVMELVVYSSHATMS